ncbi:hypothetical protein ABMY26_12940 [Azospirillum sp. HJ39]|uniref:hypothetical protein n=1 Tax=Azospirillum sp. HJ39 TaxID=3159496 RepID=UPI0035563A87
MAQQSGTARIAESSAAGSASILRSVQATCGVESMLGNQRSLLFEQDIPGKIIRTAKVDRVIWRSRCSTSSTGQCRRAAHRRAARRFVILTIGVDSDVGSPTYAGRP